MRWVAGLALAFAVFGSACAQEVETSEPQAVSYTHLTLPTIYSV